MEHAQSVAAFTGLLHQQAALTAELATYEKRLQDAVMEREWHDLEGVLPHIDRLSAAIQGIEERRNELFADIAIAVGGDGSFAGVVARLPVEVRSSLTDGYRALKVAVSALQSRTRMLDTYIRSTVATTQGILRELYPEQTRHGYSRTGEGRFATEPAVMVNHTL